MMRLPEFGDKKSPNFLVIVEQLSENFGKFLESSEKCSEMCAKGVSNPVLR